ncbi:Hypothetical protein CINCED_3A017662 [Cinara cedri]|uniref:Uncharacterized protein n=1 Tax=Cinara cedri TaxID=506608 RepID=A0A5E4MWD6_9HEMI|nr:Hypothetical protein CINCED_3A017662 [Cinara cedri]
MFDKLENDMVKLETEFGRSARGRVNVKMMIVDVKKSNTELAKLWRVVTTTLAANLLFIGKPRVEVIQHLTLSEFEAAARGEQTVIWVCKHKLGDKQPTTIVIDTPMLDMMDRYYALRRRVAKVDIPNFFITNTGTEVRKIFDLINAECKRRQIRLPRKPDGTEGDFLMVSGSMLRKHLETEGRGHRPEVTKDVASALQHTEYTAKRYYHTATADDAIKQKAIRVVEESTEMVEHIIDNLGQFMSNSDPFTETPSLEAFKEMAGDLFPNAKVTANGYKRIKAAHNKALVEPRAKMLAEKAVSMGVEGDVGIVQLKSFA